MQNLSVHQLAEWLADPERSKPVILDVREPWELEMCCLPDVQAMPMHTVPLRCRELDPESDIVVVCHHGGRSMQVAFYLERQGFHSLYNLAGGVDAWAAAIDPAMRRY